MTDSHIDKLLQDIEEGKLAKQVLDIIDDASSLSPSSTWQFTGDYNGTSLWKNINGNYACSMGKTVVKAPIKCVLDSLKDQSKFNDSYDSHHLIESYREFVNVSHVLTKPQFLISTRDFCVLNQHTGSTKKDDSVLIISVSCTHPDCEEQVNYTRASLGLGGFILKSINDGLHCELWNIVQIDLKGDLPTWLVAKFVENQGAVVTKIREYVHANVSKSDIENAISHDVIYYDNPNTKTDDSFEIDDDEPQVDNNSKLGPNTQKALKQCLSRNKMLSSTQKLNKSLRKLDSKASLLSLNQSYRSLLNQSNRSLISNDSKNSLTLAEFQNMQILGSETESALLNCQARRKA